MFGSLCLQPSYVASFPVNDLASGAVNQLTLPSLSRVEAAFLSHSICFAAATKVSVRAGGSAELYLAPAFGEPDDGEMLGGGLWMHVESKTLELSGLDLGLDAMRLLVEAVVAWGGEQNVEARRVVWEVGQLVETNVGGGGRRRHVWVPGTVVEVRTGLVKIETAAGTEAVRPDEVRLLAAAKVGQGVKMTVRRGKELSGAVVGVNDDGTVNVGVDGGGTEKGVERMKLSLVKGGGSLQVGQPVKVQKKRRDAELQRRDQKGAPATVMSVNKDRTYDIRFDDGDVAQAVKRGNIEVSTLSTVERLDLSRNKAIGSEESLGVAMELASLLPNLKELTMEDCAIEEGGLATVVQAIKDGRLPSLALLEMNGDSSEVGTEVVQALQEVWQSAGKRSSGLRLGFEARGDKTKGGPASEDSTRARA